MRFALEEDKQVVNSQNIPQAIGNKRDENQIVRKLNIGQEIYRNDGKNRIFPRWIYLTESHRRDNWLVNEWSRQRKILKKKFKI